MKRTIFLALLLVWGAAHAAEPELSQRDYNAAREYAYKYFFGYLEKHGRALRMQAILRACRLEELAAQLDHDLPEVSLYAGEQFAADSKSTPFDLSRRGMALAVALTTQSLTEGYQLGFLEAFRAQSHNTPACTGAAMAYDEYLKGKGSKK